MKSVGKWLAAVAAAVVLAGCGSGVTQPVAGGDGDGRPTVVTSVYPLYEFARAVGGDQAEVVNLIPPGTEPHDWEPSPGDIRRLNEARVFIYNGAGLEHWVSRTLSSLDNPDLVVVEASRGLDLIQGDDEHQWDPHVWLDPLTAVRLVEAIRDGLIQADPAHEEVYRANADQYIARLKDLHQEFEQGLAACRLRDFFTTHAAFGYLARRYGLTQHAIMGLSPEAEPAPRDVAQAVAEARQLGIRYVFYETMTGDQAASMLAREIGAGTLELNPFEGLTDEQIAAGEDYFSIMRANLTGLRQALECGESR